MAALTSKSPGELKNKANPPQILPQALGLGKNPTDHGRGRAEHELGRLQQRHLLYWHKASRHPAQARADRSGCFARSTLIQITFLF